MFKLGTKVKTTQEIKFTILDTKISIIVPCGTVGKIVARVPGPLIPSKGYFVDFPEQKNFPVSIRALKEIPECLNDNS